MDSLAQCRSVLQSGGCKSISKHNATVDIVGILPQRRNLVYRAYSVLCYFILKRLLAVMKSRHRAGNPLLSASMSAFFLAMMVTLPSTLFQTTTADAALYYSPQTNFIETTVPLANYHWKTNTIQGCIYKEPGIPNSYYVWTKLQVQAWRQALREYTGDQNGWTITARYSRSVSDAQSCPLQFYILKSYTEFPGYPEQTGSYTSVEYDGTGKVLRAAIFLAPIVLHADGKTVINLPPYAFRNSARHEVGHALGLAHMLTEKGYLMSPRFDYWEQKDQLPITTLELSSLVKIYGKDGWTA
jgi:hypothetical protein